MQIHHKLMIMAIVFSLILLALGQKCHAMSDYAGQGKAPITWNDLMRPQVDPSRYFAVPNVGHGNHPAGGYDAPSRSAVSRPDSPSDTSGDDQTVKPDDKPDIPFVPAPVPDDPKCKPHKKDCKPKPECKHEPAKHDRRPFCSRGDDHKKSMCSKPDHISGDKMGCKPAGLNGRPNGHGHSDGRKSGLCGKGSVGKTGHAQGHGNGKGDGHHGGHGHGKGGCR